jgi:plastocyanin
MRSRTLVSAAAVIASLAMTACGSDDDNGGGGSSSGQTLKVSAARDGGLSFDQDKLDTRAGAVTIAFDNPGPSGNKHGVAVKGSGVDKAGPVVGPGKKATLELDLKAGEYTFYCPVGGHEKAGMKGTLTVSGEGGGSGSGGGGSGPSGGGY